MDVLDQSNETYLIIVNRGEFTKVFSNFSKDDVPTLKDWIMYRHIDRLIRDQIKIIENES
jgi:hypothetical protein